MGTGPTHHGEVAFHRVSKNLLFDTFTDSVLSDNLSRSIGPVNFFYSAILKLHVPFDTYAHALCFSRYACGLISSRGLKQQRISRCLPSSRHQEDSPLGSNLAVS